MLADEPRQKTALGEPEPTLRAEDEVDRDALDGVVEELRAAGRGGDGSATDDARQAKAREGQGYGVVIVPKRSP